MILLLRTRISPFSEAIPPPGSSTYRFGTPPGPNVAIASENGKLRVLATESHE
jgi:hypothetical protein